MALIQCHECGIEISSEAKSCPKCGAKPKKIKKPINPVIKLLLLVTIAGVFIKGAIDQNDPEQLAASQDHHEIGNAEAACQLAFEKNAKNPDSVEWARDERQFMFLNQEKTKALSTQPVRAKNSFNATVKSIAICKLEKIDGTWQVKEIKEQH